MNADEKSAEETSQDTGEVKSISENQINSRRYLRRSSKESTPHQENPSTRGKLTIPPSGKTDHKGTKDGRRIFSVVVIMKFVETVWKSHKVIMATDEHGMNWFQAKSISKNIGIVNSRSTTQRIIKDLSPNAVSKHVFKIDNKRFMTIWNEDAVKFVNARKRTKQIHGEVYCFIPIGGTNVYKFGRTDNWVNRQKSYMGFNKPKHIVFVRKVENQYSVEKDLLKYLGEHPHFTQRNDLGDEWFESSMSIAEVKNGVLTFLKELQ